MECEVKRELAGRRTPASFEYILELCARSGHCFATLFCDGSRVPLGAILTPQVPSRGWVGGVCHKMMSRGSGPNERKLHYSPEAI